MYTAPTCEHRQSCLFMMDDFRFELCGCPNDTQCSGKYSAVHQGTKYSVSNSNIYEYFQEITRIQMKI